MEHFPHRNLEGARECRKIYEPCFQASREGPFTVRHPPQAPLISPPPWSPSHLDYGMDLASYGVRTSDLVPYPYPQTRPQQHTIARARPSGPQQLDLGRTCLANPHSYGAASSSSHFVRAFGQRNSNAGDDPDVHVAATTPDNAARGIQMQPSAPPVRRSVEDSSASHYRSDGRSPLSRPDRQ